MPKNKITRTYGPIHFEDLDPHRFEDLIRQLIYDYKDWQSIEATGRSGSDEGFDVRAYEKNTDREQIETEDAPEEMHPMQGNLWMIQGKREKEIGPTKLSKILDDVDPKNPPYGYILASSANFSKKSYDLFRDTLKGKGVMEFYIWGKGEMEDMLQLPKNDRILFTFFGVSLVSKRKSRSTEIRQVIANKNKLYRTLGEDGELNQSVLFRDSKDLHYPYQGEYADFKDHPRWLEHKAIGYHSQGLIVNMSKSYAYIDYKKKEYDYVEEVDLIYRKSDPEEEREERQKHRDKAERCWENLPLRNQATFFRNGLVRYDEIMVIDDKGDVLYKFPHLFVDFNLKQGPISGTYEYLNKKQGSQHPLKDYKRIEKFPKKLPEPKIGKIYEDKTVTLDSGDFNMLKHGNESFNALYDCDGQYKFLEQDDIILVANEDNENSSKHYLRITHTESIKMRDYIKKSPESEWMIQRQLGENLNKNKTLNIYEFKNTYDFVVDREKKKRK